MTFLFALISAISISLITMWIVRYVIFSIEKASYIFNENRWRVIILFIVAAIISIPIVVWAMFIGTVSLGIVLSVFVVSLLISIVTAFIIERFESYIIKNVVKAGAKISDRQIVDDREPYISVDWIANTTVASFGFDPSSVTSTKFLSYLRKSQAEVDVNQEIDLLAYEISEVP